MRLDAYHVQVVYPQRLPGQARVKVPRPALHSEHGRNYAAVARRLHDSRQCVLWTRDTPT
jgi:hypothetical protein